jgi:hypothetical protein
MMIVNNNTHAEESSSSAGDLFIRPPLFVIPVIQERKIKAIYSIEVVLEMRDKQAADLAQKIFPCLIDAIYVDLYSVLSIVWEPGFRINLSGVKQRLQRACNKVLGADTIRAVLIQSFNQQPMH